MLSLNSLRQQQLFCFYQFFLFLIVLYQIKEKTKTWFEIILKFRCLFQKAIIHYNLFYTLPIRHMLSQNTYFQNFQSKHICLLVHMNKNIK